jgi:hypothetical protein
MLCVPHSFSLAFILLISRSVLDSTQFAMPISDLNNVAITSLLPERLAHLYNDPTTLLLPSAVAKQNLSEAGLRPPRVLAERAEYVALVKRMLHLGMLELTDSPRCINGLFGVPKDDESIRLILDARPANCYFLKPATVILPSPSHLAALRVQDERDHLWVAKLDLSNFYHQLALPHWIRPYFALPALMAEEIEDIDNAYVSDALRLASRAARVSIHPCCATLPMGFSHSVFLAQSVHEHILYESGAVQPADNIVFLASPYVDRPLHGLYVDDCVLIGTEQQRLLLVYRRVVDAYRAKRLPPKTAKCVEPTLQPVTVLGMDIDGRHASISLSVRRHAKLLLATASFLAQPLVTGRELAVIIGGWTWPMLLRRPLLAALKHSYTFAQRFDCAEPRPLWPVVRRELLVLVSLSPMLVCDLRMPLWPTLLATDASMEAAGVVAAPLSKQLRTALWPIMTHADSRLLPMDTESALLGTRPTHHWPVLDASQPVLDHRRSTIDTSSLHVTATAAVEAARWTEIISAPWRQPVTHINELELHAVLIAVRWVLSHPSAVGTQLMLLTDSSSIYFGMNKGRSSSPRVLSLLRRYAALLLGGGLTVLPAWVPSALNPADDASRRLVPTMLPRKHG